MEKCEVRCLRSHTSIKSTDRLSLSSGRPWRSISSEFQRYVPFRLGNTKSNAQLSLTEASFFPFKAEVLNLTCCRPHEEGNSLRKEFASAIVQLYKLKSTPRLLRKGTSGCAGLITRHSNCSELVFWSMLSPH